MKRQESDRSNERRLAACACLVALLVFSVALPLKARDKDHLTYGIPLIVNIPLPPAEVAQVVEEIAQNGLIRGTKEYNKDQYVSGAKSTTSSKVFPAWTEGGEVFYKERAHALDPRNFKDSNDLGTLAVRYVLQPQGDKNTVLRIDAAFVEDFRHTFHPSNGSVESAEYKDIREHLDAIELVKQQTIEVEKEHQAELEKKNGTNANADAKTFSSSSGNLSASSPVSLAPSNPSSNTSASASPSKAASLKTTPSISPAMPAPEAAGMSVSQAAAVSDRGVTSAPIASMPTGNLNELEQHVHDLRQQLERLVKPPGTPLKSSPFHSAKTLQTIPEGAEVLVLISTPYWYGVETHDGAHGWIPRDQLEPLP